RAVPLRELQGRNRHRARRRHRRRIADRRPGRSRRAPSRRLLLRADHPDLGRAFRCRSPCRADGGPRRCQRALHPSPHGSAAVTRSLPILAGLAAAVTVLSYFALIYVHAHAGAPGAPFWIFILLLWLAAWQAVAGLARLGPLSRPMQRMIDLLVPVCFGAFLLFLWEVLTVGLRVPMVLLPSPSAIAAKLMSAAPVLSADFVQTFIRAVIPGWIIGCLAGFTVAVAADRVPFLARGLIPIGNFVSALPIIGIAPIMVMWFGFDWHSKAAVVVIMTFFPMLVNTVAGLSQ